MDVINDGAAMLPIGGTAAVAPEMLKRPDAAAKVKRRFIGAQIGALDLRMWRPGVENFLVRNPVRNRFSVCAPGHVVPSPSQSMTMIVPLAGSIPELVPIQKSRGSIHFSGGLIRLANRLFAERIIVRRPAQILLIGVRDFINSACQTGVQPAQFLSIRE